MPFSTNLATAALTVLIILQSVMLISLFAGVPPHPPAATPAFGMGPFIGSSVAFAASALIIGVTSSHTGRAFGVVAAVMALVSFGPQKYVDPQFHLIWPAVLTAQLTTVILIVLVFKSVRTKTEGANDAA
ncbi:MAG: hypothetical protein AB3N20_04985 [Rhizobiaceae bacterium]